MLLRLSTVRAKFTALVSLSTVAMLVALPVLSWLLHRQLVDEVDGRVTDAERAFQTELDDDIADLTLASRVIAADRATAEAFERHDAMRVHELAGLFFGIYPNIDVLVVEAGGNGRVLTQVGCQNPPENVAAIAELADVARGSGFTGVIGHGCESESSGAPPAYVIAAPIEGLGAVVVCLPVDGEYLKNSSAKLGLELAFAGLDLGARHLVGATQKFPTTAIEVARSAGTTILAEGGRSWAVQRFEPKQLVGRLGKIGMVAALDVTDIHWIIRRNLLYALAVLAAAAAISVWLGSRLAALMSEALGRVSTALQHVERLDYVHVAPVRTGDELEELARGFNTMVDGLKERDKLRTTFGKYMTATVMDHLLAGKVSLGGESLEVSILFTDIRSFTTISERMDPQQLVGLLNEYFTEMVGIVMQEDGVVDKYIGDAIMAVFGAPVPKAEDPVNAVRAAVRMRRALVGLNRSLEGRGMPALRTGIGIHTGVVVAGNIGSEQRMEYTVIGDPVNVASRLETSTKELGVDVLVSERTYELTKHIVLARPVREIVVKGRGQSVMAYEVLGLQNEVARA
jgi:adenylate cyclase